LIGVVPNAENEIVKRTNSRFEGRYRSLSQAEILSGLNQLSGLQLSRIPWQIVRWENHGPERRGLSLGCPFSNDLGVCVGPALGARASFRRLERMTAFMGRHHDRARTAYAGSAGRAGRATRTGEDGNAPRNAA